MRIDAALVLAGCAVALGAGVHAQSSPSKNAKKPARSEVLAQLARLQDADIDIRDDAFEKLRSFGALAAKPVAEALPSENEEFRRTLGLLLSEYRSSEALLATASWLRREPLPLVRRILVQAIGRTGGAQTFEPLRRQLDSDRDAAVQHDCLMALAGTKMPHAVDVLLNFAGKSEDEDLNRIAFQSLESLTSKNLGEDLEAWRAWWKQIRDEVFRRYEEMQKAREENRADGPRGG